MARTTRATKATTKPASAKDTDTKSSTSKYSLPAASINPPKILILPNNATSEARVVSLKNPRYSKPTRYLICPETGAYEFIKIAAPKTTPRSWLIEGAGHKKEEDDEEENAVSFDTQITKGADLYLATPIDPLFLTLPAFSAQFSSSNKRMFLSSDDHIETINDETPHLRDTIVRWPAWRARLEARMGAICDTVEAGEHELMYRFSEDKLLAELLVKAKRMSEGGLPKSMEDKFVTKALEAPVLGVKRSAPVVAALLKTDESTTTASESQTTSSLAESQEESQSSVATTAATSASEASTAATSVADDTEIVSRQQDIASAITASAEVVTLQRLRIAFNFICSCYVPPAMAAVLKKMLLAEHSNNNSNNNKSGVDFAPLEAYIAQLTTLRQEAMMARSASDYSRKRNNDEENEERLEKKRKKEEEEKRKKAGESRGVRDLKKVNTSGMKKLSAFFKPKGS